MSEEILKRLDDMQREMREMRSDLTTVRTDLATVRTDLSTVQSDLATVRTDLTTLRSDLTQRLDAVQGSCDANYQLMVQLQRNSTDHFEALGNAVRELRSGNGGSLRAIG